MSWLTTISLTDKTLYIPVTVHCDGLFYYRGSGLLNTIIQDPDKADLSKYCPNM